MIDRKVRDVFLTYTPYILIVIFSGLIGYVSYVTLKFDLNPVLYLLSAFIQAQSAIIAIVITLTLIAVQLSSSEYSIRLLSVMKRDALFNAIVIIYISSIIYNAMLLSVINKIGSEFVNAGLSISITNFSLSLVMLIPYIYHVLDLLRPESIIIALRKDLSKKYLNSNKHIGKLVEGYRKVDRRDVRPYFRHPSTRGLRISDDDLIPLVDLIKKAIEKDDTYTIMVGIENIAVFHEDLCNKKELSNEEKKYITRLVLRHIRRICRKACQCGDRGAIHDTLRYMNKIVIKSIKDLKKKNPL